MQRVTRKVICALLSLLLIMSGQAAVAMQDMPLPVDHAVSDLANAMVDCGHQGTDQGGSGSREPARFSDCGSVDSMACLVGVGTGHCVVIMVLASAPAFSMLGALSPALMAGHVSTYRSPFLEVLTPPPDFLS